MEMQLDQDWLLERGNQVRCLDVLFIKTLEQRYGRNFEIEPIDNGEFYVAVFPNGSEVIVPHIEFPDDLITRGKDLLTVRKDELVDVLFPFMDERDAA